MESTLYLRNQLLRDTDWASMAHSLEVRTPLVDATLLRALAAPLLHTSPGQGKQLLASAPSMSLPPEVVCRGKTGFTTPVGNWQLGNKPQPSETPGPQSARRGGPWARNWGQSVMRCHAE